jgi:DNA-binding beta-propeller fold protein YncE
MYLTAMAVFLGLLAGGVLWSGRDGRSAHTAGGSGRLLSFEPFPADGMMCEWVPTSASGAVLPVALQAGSAAADAAPERPSDAVREQLSKREPVRTVRDPSPVYSAVAVNLEHDEVVLQDENTWSILTYNRLDNTPPSARMTEPKRKIQGDATGLEFNCSLYIDQSNGDIYTMNNDTKNLMSVFAREANGDVAPKRQLKTPYFYGLAMDEEKKEMFVSAQGHIVAVFRKEAEGDEKPLRFIKGNNTRLADPHGIALDPERDELFVLNWGVRSVYETPYVTGDIPWGDGRLWGDGDGGGGMGRQARGMGKIEPASITVYRKDAQGDVAPLRVIQGPKTLLNWPTSIAIDSENGEMFVANDTGHSITVYDITANGDVAPKRIIQGPKSMVKFPTGVTYDPKNKELWVANYGNHSATVYPRTANGDVAPLRVIRSAPLDQSAPMMGNPHVLIYVDKREELLVSQ